jgi:hypothetical protein
VGSIGTHGIITETVQSIQFHFVCLLQLAVSVLIDGGYNFKFPVLGINSEGQFGQKIFTIYQSRPLIGGCLLRASNAKYSIPSVLFVVYEHFLKMMFSIVFRSVLLRPPLRLWIS